MPTIYKAELTEAEPPMRQILNRMASGIKANARPILDALGYYSRRDLEVPSPGNPLTQEEELELEPIIGSLIEAAVTNVLMRDGVKIATLKKVAKNPALVFDGQLPGAVEWELATDYQREIENSGTFSLDILGNRLTISGYSFQTPTEANIKRAAEAAVARLKEQQTPGRPPNQANAIIAFRLGNVFRSSGQSIVRRWLPEMRGRKLAMSEGGPFHDFLKPILTALNGYLREQDCTPVTAETVVRLATEQFSRPGSRVPNFSH